MLSRVADSLYWMSRYLERAENTVRQLDVAMSLMLDTGGASAETHWERLIASLGNPEGLEWTGDPGPMPRNWYSISIIRHPSRAASTPLVKTPARSAKKSLPSSGSASIGSITSCTRRILESVRSNINDVLSSLIDAIHLFKGVSDTTMIHGQGWHFIRLGRYLERAYAIATLLQVYQPHLVHPPEREHSGYQYLEQVGLLRCCTAFEAYCQVYTADLTPDRILEFLLLNRDFPHAIRYSVDGVRQAIQSIQHTGGRRPPDELTASIGRLHAMLSFTSIGEILNGDAAAFLHTIRQQCMGIHDLMYRYYIQYSIQSALAI